MLTLYSINLCFYFYIISNHFSKVILTTTLAKINFVVAETTLKVAVITFSVDKISLFVAYITFMMAGMIFNVAVVLF